jgi:hypothetical protein
MDETVGEHEDLVSIPSVIEIIKALGKETEPGVASAKQKVELWRYNANLVFSKQGEIVVRNRAVAANGVVSEITIGHGSIEPRPKSDPFRETSSATRNWVGMELERAVRSIV